MKKGKFLVGLLSGIILMLLGQILFGGWGNGLINQFWNKPEVVITEGLVFHEVSPIKITLPYISGGYSLQDIKDGKPMLLSDYTVLGTNSSHCFLSWAESEKGDYHVKLRDNIFPGADRNESEICDSDCTHMTISLKSYNSKDIENLYGEICWNHSVVLSSKDRCLFFEEDFLSGAKEISKSVDIKILDLGPNESVRDYVQRNPYQLFPQDIILRDRNNRVLSYRQIKVVTQDIFNCTTY